MSTVIRIIYVEEKHLNHEKKGGIESSFLAIKVKLM